MPTKIDLQKIETVESPRTILAAHFKSLGGELPIHGGWGYSKNDACVIDKNDFSVDPEIPFDGIGLEYIFVEKRIYEEMIIFRSEGEKYAGIKWNLLEQKLTTEKDRAYDQLIFEITAFSEYDWLELKAEWEDHQGYKNSYFDAKAHEEKRHSKEVRLIREFWFDITSFHGKPGDDHEQPDATVVEADDVKDNSDDLVEKFFYDPAEYLHFLTELKELKKASASGKSIATISKENGLYKYELTWEDGRFIGEFVKIFKPIKENWKQFDKGCAEVARRLKIFIETDDLDMVPHTPPAFGNLSDEWDDYIKKKDL
ncbi:MAG: hypothetical protein PF690_06930 [Deltaproteobacteria bacterium]|jgi:hypothetical protein|nr:hypothetical protein [Deltaproteobacteria bacterium]